MPLPEKDTPLENPGILLGLLEAVDANKNVTQRTLSSELGVALGLVNAYLKRCVKKGLVKVHEAPKRRFAYYLTPHGFAEKSKLTADYLLASVSALKRIKTSCNEAFREAENRGWKRVVLIGASEFSEIAALCAQDHAIQIIAVFDPGLTRDRFAGHDVCRSLDEIKDTADGAVLTVLQNQERWRERGAQILGEDRIIVPGLLTRAAHKSVAYGETTAIKSGKGT